MEEETNKLEQIGENWRNEDGTFKQGHPDLGAGRPPDTEEKKIIKRAIKDLVKEYKEDLAQLLPQIKTVIEKRAIEGDMTAIKEIHDRVMDKAKQPTDITTDGEALQPILVKFINGNQTDDNRDTTGV